MNDVWIVYNEGAIDEYPSEAAARAAAEEFLQSHYYGPGDDEDSGWDDRFCVWYGRIDPATYRVSREVPLDSGGVDYALGSAS